MSNYRRQRELEKSKKAQQEMFIDAQLVADLDSKRNQQEDIPIFTTIIVSLVTALLFNVFMYVIFYEN
jgi:hypothetical protein